MGVRSSGAPPTLAVRPATSTRRSPTSSAARAASARIGAMAVLGHQLDAAQQRARAGQQLAHAERLGQVVVGADLQAQHAVDLLGPRGEHQDRE